MEATTWSVLSSIVGVGWGRALIGRKAATLGGFEDALSTSLLASVLLVVVSVGPDEATTLSSTKPSGSVWPNDAWGVDIFAVGQVGRLHLESEVSALKK
jgi:hypothetical protein